MLNDAIKELLGANALEEMRKAQIALEQGKMDPDEFWADLGWDPDTIKMLATAGAAIVDIEPGFTLAAMQMGAALALFRHVAEPIAGPQI